MRTLVIDTATGNCSAALYEDASLVAGLCETLGRGHAERLVPMIAELPDNGRADAIVVALGPGSFTGIRVGLAAARALALAWQARISGYSTPALIAAQARQRAGPVPVSVASLAGHGEWFIQNFDASGIAEAPVVSLRPDKAIASSRHEAVAGNAADALVEGRGHGIAFHMLSDARCFHLLGEDSRIDKLAPIYGRAPDAKPAA